MIDSQKFSKLVTESQEQLYAYIYSLIGHTASAWDVLQEANVVLWAKRGEFQEGTNFRAWAHTVARFQVLAYLRDKSREPLSLLTPEIMETFEAENEPSPVGHDHRLKALGVCIQKLAPMAGRIIHLHYQEKQSLRQISEQLSMTTNAAKQALFRARRNLQNCIETFATTK